MPGSPRRRRRHEVRTGFELCSDTSADSLPRVLHAQSCRDPPKRCGQGYRLRCRGDLYESKPVNAPGQGSAPRPGLGVILLKASPLRDQSLPSMQRSHSSPHLRIGLIGLICFLCVVVCLYWLYKSLTISANTRAETLSCSP